MKAANSFYVGNTVISFAPGLSGTIQVGSSSLLSGNVAIRGPGAGLITLDGPDDGFGILAIGSGSSVSVSGLTFANASNSQTSFLGGAISVPAGATLSLSNDLFTNNANVAAGVGNGGAITNNGTLLIDHCTFENNQASIVGGAIYNTDTLTVVDSTLADNSAGDSGHPGSGGAIYNGNTGTTTLINDTVSGNSVFSGLGPAGVFNARGTLVVGDCIIAANLSQSVNSTELQSLLNHFNSTGGWTIGDFNYTATINSTDLQSILNNFNQSLGALAATPATASVSPASKVTLSDSRQPTPNTDAITLAATSSTDNVKPKKTLKPAKKHH